MTRRLLEPFLEGGVRHPNFSNGIVLTAEALAAAQRAGRDLDRHLGRALGPGIVQGLEVRLVRPGSVGVTPQIAITGGLAINALGDTLALAATEVVLEPVQPAPPPEPGAGLFGDCEAMPEGDDGARGTFLLALGPASGFDGKILRLDLVAETPAPGCAHRFAVEGVRFKLVPLPLPADVAADATRLRNRIAHHCFGTAELGLRPHNPFAVPEPPGAVATLAATAGSGLSACDVPIAVLSWPAATIAFLDAWPVRRRPQGSATAALWPQHLPRRRADAEAVLFQFEDELAALVAAGSAPATMATRRFRFLPAAGYLPIGAGRFAPATFFAGLETEEQPLDEAYARQVVEAGFAVDPIDLDAPPRIALLKADGAGYLVFARLPAAVEQQDAAPAAPSTPSTPPVEKGGIEVTVRLGTKIVSGKEREKAVKLQEPAIEVTAEDEAGRVRHARRLRDRNAFEEFLKPGGTPSARFLLDALEPGSWTVRVRATGFQPASRAVQVRGGRREQVAIALRPSVPGTGPGGKRPPPKHDFDWYRPGWFKRGVVIPEIRWPWPPRDVLDFDTVTDPPPDMLDWAADWAEALGGMRPEAPFDPAGTQVFIDPSHLPGARAEKPYAYLAFGEGGAYVPLVLVPSDAALPRDVAVAAGGIADIDAGAAAALTRAGVADMETLAASWTGLVQDALGLTGKAAASLLADAQGRVAHFAGAGELETFRGMVANLQMALTQAGIANAVALANAEPAELGATLRSLGMEIGDGFAARLVEEARATTDSAAWSLDAPALGLDAQEVATLARLGITSQGGRKAAAQDGGAARLAAALGRTAEAVRGLAGSLDIGANAVAVEAGRIAAAPVTAIPGEVRTTDAQLLAASGFGTIGRLAGADIGAVTAALGGDRARAERLVAGAQGRIGGT